MNPAYLILLLSSLALLATLAVDGWRHLRRALRDTRRDWRILRGSRALVSAAVKADLMLELDEYRGLPLAVDECRISSTLRLHSPLWLESARAHRRHAEAARRRLINRSLAAVLGGTVLWLAARNLARPFGEWLLGALFS